jgi:hypothetical protein
VSTAHICEWNLQAEVVTESFKVLKIKRRNAISLLLQTGMELLSGFDFEKG